MSLLDLFLRAFLANAALAVLVVLLGPLASVPAFLLLVVLVVAAPAFMLLVSVPLKALGAERERPVVRFGAYAAMLAICLWGIHGVSPSIAQALGAGTLGFLSCISLLLVVEAVRHTALDRVR